MHTDKREAAEAFIEKVIVPRRATRSSDPEASRARAELDCKDLELAKRELVAMGLDPERLDKLAAERSKARKKLAGDARRRAVDASAAVADRLKGLVPVILPADPVDTVIDEVTFIRGFAGQGRRGEWNIGPSDNWAKYRLESDTDDSTLPGRLSFFLLWQNRKDSSIVLMARPNLVVNAHISCEADANGTGSWFSGVTSQARATVRARTTVWNMDSSISSIVNDQVLGLAVARGNFWGDDSSESIAFNEILPASGISIAPQAWSLIEVELVTEWQRLHGSVVVDAEAGSRRIAVPQIVLTEIRPTEPTPTISLSASVSYATTPATVTLKWTGATAATVDIYVNGALYGTSANDGQEMITRDLGIHTFHVCNAGSAVCSMDVSVTV
jgi:hypothetical protein